MNPVVKKVGIYSWIAAIVCFSIGNFIVWKTYGIRPSLAVALIAAGLYFRIVAVLFAAVQEIKSSLLVGVPLTEQEIANMQAQSDMEHEGFSPDLHSQN